MSHCEMYFPGYPARSNRALIRWELFLHRDVRDVLPTEREDILRVVYRGQPEPVRWRETLVGAGFPEPYFELSPVTGSPRS